MDSLGQMSNQVTNTVTVAAEPALQPATPDTATVPSGGDHVFQNTITVDTTAGVAVASCHTVGAYKGSVTVDNTAQVVFDTAGLPAGSYPVTIECVDSLGQVSNQVTNTVVVSDTPLVPVTPLVNTGGTPATTSSIGALVTLFSSGLILLAGAALAIRRRYPHTTG
jgi:predicted phage tail protein